MKTIDRFFVAKGMCIPFEASDRHKQCPHESVAKDLYKIVVEKDIAEIEVKNGSPYCWNSCAITNCPAYTSNRK